MHKCGTLRRTKNAAIVRIGKVQPGVDAVTAASPRKKAEELVTYK